MPTLADIYSAIDTAKRKGGDFIRNPGTSLQQMLNQTGENLAARRARDEAVWNQAHGDPMNPLRITDPEAFKQEVSNSMDLMSFAPAGMIGKSLANKYPNVALEIVEKPTSLDLAKIVVPPEMRNQGVGSNVMKDLIQYADENGKKINLSPSSDFGGSPTRLQKFYKSFGFKDNRGRSRDFSTTETMVRNPVQIEKTIGNDMKTYKTSDGFTFYELPDGRIVDNLDPNKVDMSWDNYKQLKDDFGDDVYQLKDQLGERKAMVSSFGTAKPQELMNSYNQFMETATPDVLYQRALNKQNTKPELKLVKK